MLTIISKEKNSNGTHNIESQSGRTAPWLEGYITVPADLVAKAWESCGFCNLVFDEAGALTDIELTEKPTIEEPAVEPTTEERVAALEAENAALTQQLTDTQLALCDVYEALMAVTATEEGEQANG